MATFTLINIHLYIFYLEAHELTRRPCGCGAERQRDGALTAPDTGSLLPSSRLKVIQQQQGRKTAT